MTKSFRTKELSNISKKIGKTSSKEGLEKLRGDAHEIWRLEHNFGASRENEKKARLVYDRINRKLDRQRLSKLSKSSRRKK